VAAMVNLEALQLVRQLRLVLQKQSCRQAS
jgi:hypothetical protein